MKDRHSLSADDRRVWAHVTRGITPLHRHPARDETPAQLHAEPMPQAAHWRAVPHVPARAAGPSPIPIADTQTAKKLRRGKIPCDATLDLHGLTLAQAHGALTSFLRAQASRGARCVLVISGKGSPTGGGRIKAELGHWLNSAPLRGLIWATMDAPSSRGGALYVMLKRPR
ncbi:MAG: Smr/MutS family protein [Rhodospirillaceae bacterium]|nr:Smr/MutS family protein [Rhodospirillaceae bacterium]